MKKINEKIDTQLIGDGFIVDYIVSAVDVKNAISRLKCDKGDVNTCSRLTTLNALVMI